MIALICYTHRENGCAWGHVWSWHRTADAAYAAMARHQRECRRHNGPGTWRPLAVVEGGWQPRRRAERDRFIGGDMVYLEGGQ